MSSFVLVFVPWRETRGDIETALHKHVDPEESIKKATATRSEPIEDVEQLALWRWITF